MHSDHTRPPLPGRLVVVIGKAGSGKSEIVRRTCLRLDRGKLPSGVEVLPVRQWTTEDANQFPFITQTPADFAMAAQVLFAVYRYNGHSYGIRPSDLERALPEGIVLMEGRRSAVAPLRALVQQVFVVEILAAGTRTPPDGRTVADMEDEIVRVHVDTIIVNHFPDGPDRAVDELCATLTRLSR